jgi:hypothetical protein
MSLKKTGSCLCGAVTLEASPQKKEIAACHCGQCATWGGSALLVVDGGTDVKIEGAENITTFRHAPDAKGERAFCKICGTHLYCKVLGPDIYLIPAGFLHGIDDFKLTAQVFIDKKPSYYHFAEPTLSMTEKDMES